MYVDSNAVRCVEGVSEVELIFTLWIVDPVRDTVLELNLGSFDVRPNVTA